MTLTIDIRQENGNWLVTVPGACVQLDRVANRAHAIQQVITLLNDTADKLGEESHQLTIQDWAESQRIG